MTSGQTAPAAHEPTNPFGDPWNARGTAVSDLRTTLLVGAFVIAVGLFAFAAVDWVSNLAEAPRAGLASAPKSSAAEENAKDRASETLVLAPRSMTPTQAAQFAEGYRATPDGYFAVVSYERYDVVLNGSTSVSGATASPTRDLAAVRVTESETGLSAMFSRDGAAYQIEFVCRGAGAETGVACISAAEARAFVADLVEAPPAGR